MSAADLTRRVFAFAAVNEAHISAAEAHDSALLPEVPNGQPWISLRSADPGKRRPTQRRYHALVARSANGSMEASFQILVRIPDNAQDEQHGSRCTLKNSVFALRDDLASVRCGQP